MKSLKLSAAVLAGLMVVFSSCKKDKDDPAPSKSKTEYLTTAKGWKTTAYTLNGASMMAFISDCEKSGVQVFKSDGTYSFSYPDKCDTDYTGTWKFLNNESQIVIDEDTSNLGELSGTTFKYSTTYQEMGQTFKEETVLTAQ